MTMARLSLGFVFDFSGYRYVPSNAHSLLERSKQTIQPTIKCNRMS